MENYLKKIYSKIDFIKNKKEMKLKIALLPKKKNVVKFI